MKWNEVKNLLEHNGLEYKSSRVENIGEHHRQQGFLKSKENHAIKMITIPNPYHDKNIELIFDSDGENPKFYDLDFGGYCYELFDCNEDDIEKQLIKEIKDIISGNVYIIFARNVKSGEWFFDGCFFDSPDEDENTMDEFRDLIARIRSPKSWIRKITKRIDQYEIFNWNSYECVIK